MIAALILLVVLFIIFAVLWYSPPLRRQGCASRMGPSRQRARDAMDAGRSGYFTYTVTVLSLYLWQ